MSWVDLHRPAPHEHRRLVGVGQRLGLDDALHVGAVAVARGNDDGGGVLHALADGDLRSHAEKKANHAART